MGFDAGFDPLGFATRADKAQMIKFRAKPEGKIGSSQSTFFQMKESEEYIPGSFAMRGPWSADKLSPQAFAKKQLSELNNGRLAMIAILLIVVQELVTQEPVELLDGDF